MITVVLSCGTNNTKTITDSINELGTYGMKKKGMTKKRWYEEEMIGFFFQSAITVVTITLH